MNEFSTPVRIQRKKKKTISEKVEFYNVNPFPLLGSSESIIKIKRQLIYASQVCLPIFISGESGTEKRSVARYIHHNRQKPTGDFIYVPSHANNIDEFKWYLDESVKNAANGTLFLSEVDKLSDRHRDYLIFIFSNHEIYRQLTDLNIQLIVSCTESLTNGQQFLSKVLGNSAPHLELYVPPLKNRKDDISCYIDHFIESFGCTRTQTLTKESRDLLCNYSWPGNVSQLQKVMMVLLSSYSSCIDAQDILSLGIIALTDIKPDLIDCLLIKDIEHYQNTHPALYKALVYLCHHYREDILLQDIADASYTSPSHLSFLFRQYLDNSFKTILVQLRVKYAKGVIDNNPMVKVTDVCLQSGFGDLSHFEKMFKRHEQCTPRQYRQKQRDIYKESLNN